MTTTLPRGTQATATAPSPGIRRRLREHRVFFLAIGSGDAAHRRRQLLPAGRWAGGAPGQRPVPIGLLAAGAAAYPAVRAGARGVLAIAIGLMGILVGLVEAGYYARGRPVGRRLHRNPGRRRRAGPAGTVVGHALALPPAWWSPAPPLPSPGTARDPRHRVPHRGLPPVRYQLHVDPCLHGKGAGARSRSIA